jgi:nitrite reductase (NADH) large subunit
MKREQLVVIGNSMGGSVETRDVGAVAVEAGRWKIYVGIAAESRMQKGDVLCTVATHAEVLKYMGRFIQFYRENGKYLERSHDFVKRISIEKVRQVLVEDSNGICARLDAEIERAVRSCRDPCQEETDPIHPSQFAEVLEPVGAAVSQ